MTMLNNAITRLEQYSATLAELQLQARHRKLQPRLEAVTTDIIECLNRINEHWLKDYPKEGIAVPLVYAVSGILSLCLDAMIEMRQDESHSAMARELLTAAWRIHCAWDALLAGDIDENLHEHVALEEEVRTSGAGGTGS